jgi:hypothetical protein
VVLKPQNLLAQLRLVADCSTPTTCPSLSNRFNNEYWADIFPEKMLEAIRVNGHLKKETIAECTEQNGRIQYRGKCYVPVDNQLWLRIIHNHHDSALARHQGTVKPFGLLERKHNSKDMPMQVAEYAQNCLNCQQSWTWRHSTFGVLRPLPVPGTAWENISMNFVVGLPECEGFDAI